MFFFGKEIVEMIGYYFFCSIRFLNNFEKKQILSRWFEKGEDFSTTDSTATFQNSFFPIDFWEKEKEWEKVIRPLV